MNLYLYFLNTFLHPAFKLIHQKRNFYDEYNMDIYDKQICYPIINNSFSCKFYKSRFKFYNAFYFFYKIIIKKSNYHKKVLFWLWTITIYSIFSKVIKFGLIYPSSNTKLQFVVFAISIAIFDKTTIPKTNNI